MKFFVILFSSVCFFLLCKRVEYCTETDGVWYLQKIIKNGNIFCEYDHSFYYTFSIWEGRMNCVQWRNGVDSVVHHNPLDCNEVWYVTKDSFRVGDLINYAVLVKDF